MLIYQTIRLKVKGDDGTVQRGEPYHLKRVVVHTGEGGPSELGHFYTLSEQDGMFWILDDSITKGPYSWEDVSKIASGENNKSTSAYMLLYSKGSESDLDRSETYVPSTRCQQLML